MSRSGRHKEKYRNDSDVQDNVDEGTSARTRPFSFEDIMARRRMKELSQSVRGEHGKAEFSTGRTVVEELSDIDKACNDNEALSLKLKKHSLDEVMKVSSVGRGEHVSARKDKSEKSIDRKSHESKGRSIKKEEPASRKEDKPVTDKGKRYSGAETKSTVRLSSEVRYKDSEGRYKDYRGDDEDRNSHRNKHGERLRDDHEGSEVRYKDYRGEDEDRNSHRNNPNKHGERLRDDHEGSGVRYKDYRGEDEDRNSHRSKHGERLWDDHEGKDRKKSSRDMGIKERYDERDREKSDRESKRKQRDVDDWDRVKTVAKKHDSRRHGIEILEKKVKEERSLSHYGDAKMRRKRSRSREREKGRDRRSASLSPKAHKHVSHNGRTHQESSLDKDKTGKQHGDLERRYTSNGSSKHYHGHGGSSGLGGYSPRKRKSEKATKTPSPVNRSPERKNAGWDVPPSGAKDSNDSAPESFPSTNQAISASVHEVVHNISAALSIMKPPPAVVYNSFLAIKNNASIDSIQLTESTRPMRRLYVENIPASASEKDVMECLNNYLLSSGVNHIQGTNPCISCMIHKEKGQALVEFLTPQDASAALSFDGSSFFSSILKIRRPKDFVEVTTGYTNNTAESSKSVATTHSLSNIVNDSPHKIFVGGISELLSSEMLIEITSAFGLLKAFHFEGNKDSRDRYAFLEYLDQSATLKACAGLNGMKIGGQVLTVVLAVPNPSSMENTENPSLYAIPDNAKPLLQEPSQVLKLKNVFAPESLSSLSETDLEEVLEDIRLECARFGTIRSLNVAKHETGLFTHIGSLNFAKTEVSAEPLKNLEMESDGKIEEFDRNEQVDNTANVKESEAVAESNMCDDVWVNDPLEGDTGRLDGNLDTHDLACENASGVVFSLETDQLKNPNDQLECQGSDTIAKTQVEDVHSEEQLQESKQLDMEGSDIVKTQVEDIGSEERLQESKQLELEEDHKKSMDAIKSYRSMLVCCNAMENGDNAMGQDPNLESVFEPGSVLVEYKRTENACMAAHSLHGRMFDERTITVEYIPLDMYLSKFPR